MKKHLLLLGIVFGIGCKGKAKVYPKPIEHEHVFVIDVDSGGRYDSNQAKIVMDSVDKSGGGKVWLKPSHTYQYYDTLTIPGVPQCGYITTDAEADTCLTKWQLMVNYYTNIKGYRIIAALRDDWTIIIVPKGTPKYKPK